MTKRDFFLIALKLAGLFLFFSILVDIFSFLLNFKGKIRMEEIYVFLYLFLLLGLFFYFFLYKPGIIISLLKLDKGFDTDKFDGGSLTKIDFAQVTLFLLGAYFFISSLPPFLTQSFLFFKQNASPQPVDLSDVTEYLSSHFRRVNYYLFVFSFLRLLIGYLIMTNYDLIVRKFFK